MLLVIGFILLPKVVFLCCFIYNVMILNPFCYSYKMSRILLLPLLEKYISYNIETFCVANIAYTDDTIVFTNTMDNKRVFALVMIYNKLGYFEHIKPANVICSFTPAFLEEWQNIVYDKKNTMDNYLDHFLKITASIKIFEIIYTLDKEYFTIFYFFSYLMVWIYLLIYNFLFMPCQITKTRLT